MSVSYSVYPLVLTHTEFSTARLYTKKGNYVIMKLIQHAATLLFLLLFSTSKLLPRVGNVSVSYIFTCPFFCLPFKSTPFTWRSMFYYRSSKGVWEKINLKEELDGFCFGFQVKKKPEPLQLTYVVILIGETNCWCYLAHTVYVHLGKQKIDLWV